MTLKNIPIILGLCILLIPTNPIFSDDKVDILDEFESVATHLKELMLNSFLELSKEPSTSTSESQTIASNQAENTSNTIDKKTLEKMAITEHYVIAQKVIVPEKSLILVKGDLHGDSQSIPALIEILKAKRWISDDLILNKNLFLVFLGDYIDRGPDSVGVIYQITELKQRNPSSVFLLRGNHDTFPFLHGIKSKKDPTSLANQLAQLQSKYRQNSHAQNKKITHILNEVSIAFALMPQILFIGYQDTTTNRTNYATFLHGGIPHFPQKGDDFYINNPVAFYIDAPKIAENLLALQRLIWDPLKKIDILQCDILAHKKGYESYASPYLWNDFLPTEKISQDQISAINKARGPQAWAIGQLETENWLKNLSNEKNNLSFIIRGHQQSPRYLFEKKGLEGMARRWNGTVLTLDYSPRVPGFKAIYDVYIALKPDPKRKFGFQTLLRQIPT